MLSLSLLSTCELFPKQISTKQTAVKTNWNNRQHRQHRQTDTFSSRRRRTSWNNVQKMSIYYSEIRAGHIGQTHTHRERGRRDRHSCVTNSVCPIPVSCRVYKYFLIWIITVCQVFIVIYSHKFPWCMQFKWLWQRGGRPIRPQNCQKWQHKTPKMESTPSTPLKKKGRTTAKWLK